MGRGSPRSTPECHHCGTDGGRSQVGSTVGSTRGAEVIPPPCCADRVPPFPTFMQFALPARQGAGQIAGRADDPRGPAARGNRQFDRSRLQGAEGDGIIRTSIGRGHGAVGSASAWHAEGQGFESPWLHFGESDGRSIPSRRHRQHLGAGHGLGLAKPVDVNPPPAARAMCHARSGPRLFPGADDRPGTPG